MPYPKVCTYLTHFEYTHQYIHKKCYVILNKKFYGLFSYFFNTLWWNCFIRYTFCSFYILLLIFANLSLKMYSVFNLRKKEIFLPWHYAVHLVAPPLLILLAWHFLKRLLLQVKKKYEKLISSKALWNHPQKEHCIYCFISWSGHLQKSLGNQHWNSMFSNDYLMNT